MSDYSGLFGTPRLATLSLILGGCLTLLLLAQWLGFPMLQIAAFRNPQFKQVTGYTQLALMLANVFYGLWRVSPLNPKPFWRLLWVHQTLGLLTALGLAVHASAVPTGYLQWVWVLVILLALTGGLRHQIHWTLSPKVHQGLLIIHIASGCLIAIFALVHVYFVYHYTR